MKQSPLLLHPPESAVRRHLHICTGKTFALGSRSPAVHVSSNGAMANGASASNGVSAMECDNELNGTVNGADTFPEDLRTRRTRNTAHTEKLINYGKELSTMAKMLTPPNNQHVLRLRKRMEVVFQYIPALLNHTLQDAFSLLAYSDPWQSPLAHLLSPAEREPVANALNRAILRAFLEFTRSISSIRHN